MLGKPSRIGPIAGSETLLWDQTVLSVLFNDFSVRLSGPDQMASRCGDLIIPVISAVPNARVKIEWRGGGVSSAGSDCFIAIMDGRHLHDSHYSTDIAGYGGWSRMVKANQPIQISIWTVCRTGSAKSSGASVSLDSIDISLILDPSVDRKR